MEQAKKLTTKEENFARNIAFGKTQVEAYKLAGYSISAYQTMACESNKIFHKPHIQNRIIELAEEIKNNDIQNYIWNREIATEKLAALIDRINLDDEKRFLSNGKLYLNCIHELNEMWRISDQVKNEEKVIVNFINDIPPGTVDEADL